MTIFPVILCGGSGTRMWPLSRSGYPKQFLALQDDHSLLQHTMRRLGGLDNANAANMAIVMTNDEQRFLVAEQLREIDAARARIVLEPVGRNTGPAIAAAAHLAMQEDTDAIVLVLPSDHLIDNADAFAQAVGRALPHAANGGLVTFGIPPTEPHTGYGYIRRGASLSDMDRVYRVAQFVEKPDLARAQEFVAGGEHLWNSGMFLFSARTYLNELGRFAPDVLHHVGAAVDAAQRDFDFIRLDKSAFERSPADSVDYMVMERTEHAVVVEAKGLGWNDIGTWSALAQVSDRDECGNTFRGDVVALDATNSFVRSEHRMVAVLGIDSLIVVETADAVLIADKARAQDVKKIVDRLNVQGRKESEMHRKVPRPWGSYEGIDSGERFQVKRIVVNPGASLSLQMHYHRAEHWIVVSGTARVTNGDSVRLLSENQSTYIPLGTPHRLENPGKVPLEMIEVQSGSYLGEDDIVRFEDNYGRTSGR